MTTSKTRTIAISAIFTWSGSSSTKRQITNLFFSSDIQSADLFQPLTTPKGSSNLTPASSTSISWITTIAMHQNASKEKWCMAVSPSAKSMINSQDILKVQMSLPNLCIVTTANNVVKHKNWWACRMNTSSKGLAGTYIMANWSKGFLATLNSLAAWKPLTKIFKQPAHYLNWMAIQNNSPKKEQD